MSMHTTELNALAVSMLDLGAIDKKYVLYYDESNNLRRFRIIGNRFNNSDPGCFVLAGIGHEGCETEPL